MDVYEALLSRRTVFKYEDAPVPDDVLDRALEAARWAPNHKLTEPWHQGQDEQQREELTEKAKHDGRGSIFPAGLHQTTHRPPRKGR